MYGLYIVKREERRWRFYNRISSRTIIHFTSVIPRNHFVQYGIKAKQIFLCKIAEFLSVKHLRLSSYEISIKSMLFTPALKRLSTRPSISSLRKGERLWITTRFGISEKMKKQVLNC